MLLRLDRLKLTTPIGPAWMSQVGPGLLGIRSIDARLPATVKLNPPIDPIAPGAMRQTIMVRAFVVVEVDAARTDRDAVAARPPPPSRPHRAAPPGLPAPAAGTAAMAKRGRQD